MALVQNQISLVGQSTRTACLISPEKKIKMYCLANKKKEDKRTAGSCTQYADTALYCFKPVFAEP